MPYRVIGSQAVYANGKKYRPGDEISELPDSSIPWLLEAGNIVEVELPPSRISSQALKLIQEAELTPAEVQQIIRADPDKLTATDVKLYLESWAEDQRDPEASDGDV